MTRSRSWPLWLLAAAGGLAVVAAVFLLTGGDGGGPAPAPEAAMALANAAAPAAAAGAEQSAGGPATAGEGDAPAALQGEPSAREPVSVEGIFLDFSVTDKATGGPVPAYRLRVCAIEPRIGEVEIFEGDVRNAAGRFRLRLEKPGRYSCEARTDRHLREKVWRKIPDEFGATEIQIELDPGASVSGCVVDAESGLAVGRAIVGVARCGEGFELQRKLEGDTPFHFTSLPRLRQSGDLATVHAVSDEDGRFALRGLLPMEMLVVAAHPDYAEAFVRATPGSTGSVELRLRRGFRVFGQARDDHGRPAEGVMVYLWGSAVYLTRVTLTGPDGRYRTEPAPAGDVSLWAEVAAEEEGAAGEFTAEYGTAALVDRDVEVNFGPRAEHATLIGSVIDYTGEPLERCIVYLDLRERTAGAISANARPKAESGENGRFRIKKLVPGRWGVKVAPQGQRAYEWGELTIDAPGESERGIDLRACGGAVHGVVVDVATGAPPRDDTNGGRVFASEFSKFGQGEGVEAPANAEDGTFWIRGLPEATYVLIAQGRNYASADRPTVRVDAGRVTDGVRLEVEVYGTLRLVLAGFSPDELKAVKCAAELKTAPRLDWPLAWGADRPNPLPPGQWEAQVHLEGAGDCTAAFTVAPGEVTELTIHRSDLAAPGRSVTVKGTLRHFDGRPVPGAEIGLQWSAGGRKPLKARTDGSGEFEIAEVESGTWSVSAGVENEGFVGFRLSEVVVSADAGDPFYLDLVVPSGAVRGELYNEATDLPIGIRDAAWRVTAVPPGSGFLGGTAGLVAGEGDPRFRLCGLQAGTYMLWIHCDGFEMLQTEPFQVRDGEDIDLGPIRMRPTGVVDLEVVDQSGEPVQHFDVRCNGERAGEHTGCARTLGPGKSRFWLLPEGDVTIQVDAYKHGSREVPARLEPGVPLQLRVVLESQ